MNFTRDADGRRIFYRNPANRPADRQPLIVERPVTATRPATASQPFPDLRGAFHAAMATAVAEHRWQAIGRQVTPEVCEQIRLALQLGCEQAIDDEMGVTRR